MDYPYTDELMRYDEVTNQYVLTEQGANSFGFNIRAALSDTQGDSDDSVIDSILTTVSDMVYGYIHMFNTDNNIQDVMIAKVPSLRNIIFQAMKHQLIYYRFNGNLYYSINPEEQSAAICEMTKQTLMKRADELGISICYGGNIRNIWLMYRARRGVEI